MRPAGFADALAAVGSPARLYRRLKISLVRPLIRPVDDPISYAEEDWDTLIVLDGCRYDVFRDRNVFEGTARKVHSNASHTVDFLTENFSEPRHDVVYVSATPQVTRVEENLHRVYHLWETDWDDECDTVRPETVTERALEAHERHPDKRLVVHYMQPHYPFIGPKGRELGDHGTYTGGLRRRHRPIVWEMIAAGSVDAELVREAYVENLDIALPHVRALTDRLDGKSVVTSDHGNLFGERVSRLPITVEGHPPRFNHPDLTAVPWLELPFEERREVVAEEPEDRTWYSERAEEKLRAIGYV